MGNGLSGDMMSNDRPVGAMGGMGMGMGAGLSGGMGPGAGMGGMGCMNAPGAPRLSGMGPMDDASACAPMSAIPIIPTTGKEQLLVGEDDLDNPLFPTSLVHPPAVISQRVRNDVRNPGSKPRTSSAPAVKYTWRTSQYRGMTESECEVVEKELAERECGRNLRFKPLTRPLTYKVRKDGTEVARLSCPFDLECACPWKLRRIRHSTSNGYRYDLEFADHAHADHHSRTSSAHGQRHQLSKRIKGLIDSPTKILAKPRQLVQALRSQANVTAQDVPLIVAERFRLLQ